MGGTSSFSSKEIDELQKAFCSTQNINCVASPANSKLGVAISTKGRVPINGLRHPIVGDTSGWYIWFGEEFSEAPDFFVPLHAYHVDEEHPELISLLALRP